MICPMDTFVHTVFGMVHNVVYSFQELVYILVYTFGADLHRGLYFVGTFYIPFYPLFLVCNDLIVVFCLRELVYGHPVRGRAMPLS